MNIDQALTDFLTRINDMLSNTISDSSLLSDLPNAYPKIYKFASSAQTAILPVGYTILALFFLLEMWNISKRVESTGGGHQLGVELIVGALVKMLVCRLIISNADIIMQGIYEVFRHITSLIAGVSLSSFDTAELVVPSVEGGFFYKVGCLILALLIFAITAGAWLVSRGLVFLRFIELYIYLIVSPVPLATLPSDEWGQIGKSFLKSFASVAIQGTLIYIVLSLFPLFLSLSNEFAADGGYIGSLLRAAGGSLLLIAALFGTTRLANSITGAM